MAIAIIDEAFDIYDDPLDYESGEPIAPSDVPAFQLTFIVRSPYYATNMDGEEVFIRKYRRQLKQLKTKFTEKERPILIESRESDKGLGFLSHLNQAVKELKEMLESEFTIPDQIELDTIDLLGAWHVYEGDQETKLLKDLEEEANQSMADLSKRFKI